MLRVSVISTDIFKIIVIVGLACSTIAGLMADVITFSDYSHHFAEKRHVVKQSLGAAGVTFLFSFLTTLGIALVVECFL
jgi:hypothetical protein